MLKLAIFDDEHIVLEGLKKMINWSHYDVELVGTASDGFEAMSLFIDRKPDIVLTDIRMPGIDGLHVIERILKEKPETICIVFSGFNEVEYLKKAIKLGVIDYLEKPITLSMIDEVMKRTIKKNSENKRIEMLESTWQQNYQTQVEKAILDILMFGESKVDSLRSLMGNKLNRLVGVTVLAAKKEPKGILIHPDYEAIYVRNGREHLIVILYFNHGWEVYLNQIISSLGNVIIGVGKTYFTLGEMINSYKEAQYAQRYVSFMSETRILKYEDMEHSLRTPKELNKVEHKIISSLRMGERKELLQHLSLFVRKLEDQTYMPEVKENLILNLIFKSIEILKEIDNESQTLLNEYFPQQEIQNIPTWKDMVDWLYDQIEMLSNRIIESQYYMQQSVIDKACNYINNYWKESITLQDVADYVGMNPSYLSQLFKEKMGMTYIQYLTHIRMEHAKQMLLNGEKVIEVSEKIGYHSYRHFSDLFKKYVGVKPSSYRNS